MSCEGSLFWLCQSLWKLKVYPGFIIGFTIEGLSAACHFQLNSLTQLLHRELVHSDFPCRSVLTISCCLYVPKAALQYDYSLIRHRSFISPNTENTSK